MARPDVRDVIQWYGEAKALRSPYETDYRMAAAYCMPKAMRRWQTEGPTSGQSGTGAERLNYDTTGVRCLPKYAAVLERLATPQSMVYHTLRASDDNLMKIWAVRDFFDTLNSRMLKKRYEPSAMFIVASNEIYQQMGVYGCGPVFTKWRKKDAHSRTAGMFYKACNFADIFLAVDNDGRVTTVFRRFWTTAINFKRQWPNEVMPKCIANALTNATTAATTKFEMFHFVTMRSDFQPGSLFVNGKPWVGSYVLPQEQLYVGEEEGFLSMPYLTPRVNTEAEEIYPFSPAMMALPALGGVSAMKKTTLKQGQKAADPPVLAHDDGSLSGKVDLRPGRVTYGAIDANGRQLVVPFQTPSNFQIALEQIQDEREDINDSFFVTLFQILTETPEMTATEVMERVNEKASLLAPTMGRLQSEFLGPLIARELDLLADAGEMPEMPPELVEAEGQYTVQYSSPNANSQQAEGVASFFRLNDVAINIASATGKPDILDYFDYDTALPEVATIMSVPNRWMTSPDKLAEKRNARAEDTENQQLVDQAPALASVAKAVMDKDINVRK